MIALTEMCARRAIRDGTKARPPCLFTSEADGYRFRTSVATGELAAGAVSAEIGAGAHKVASPAGFGLSYQPVFQGIWDSDRLAA